MYIFLLLFLMPQNIYAKKNIVKKNAISFKKAIEDEKISGLLKKERKGLEKNYRYVDKFIKNKTALYYECAQTPQEAICDYLIYSEDKRKQRKKKKSLEGINKEKINTLQEYFNSKKEENIKFWINIESDLVSDVVGKSVDKDVLYWNINTITQKKLCGSSLLFLYLGMDLEKLLPDKDAFSMLMKWYDYGLACPLDKDAPLLGLRRGLFLYSLGKDQEALDGLEKVSQILDIDALADHYKMRLDFWKIFIAIKNSNKKEYTYQHENFIKKYPLSFHAFILDLVSSSVLSKNIAEKEPHLVSIASNMKQDLKVSFQFKSKNKEHKIYLNDVAHILEILLSLKKYQQAQELIEYFDLKTIDMLSQDRSEKRLSFHLYLMVLYVRAKAYHKVFSLAAELLKVYPELFYYDDWMRVLYPHPYLDLIKKHSQGFQPFFIASIIRQESSFNPNAVSSAKAVGLMQIIKGLSRTLIKKPDNFLFKPAWNIQAGIKFLYELNKRGIQRVDLMLSSYNAGPNRVIEWQKRYNISNEIVFMDLIPYRETREYVSSIARNFVLYHWIYNKNKVLVDINAFDATTQMWDRFAYKK